MTPAPKVSVVVATYCPGDGLDRLIASLDAQSLPRDEWEAIFVDDGSPDGTYERLLALAAERPNMRVERIENSGWPCRPRNVGTDIARGEYVAYMDHDDALYPDALREGYAFAAAHGADVLNGKEARTHDPGWAIDQYREDCGQAIHRTDFHPLLPTNPHKLYRRALLDEHGIRFREGGRVLWEDIFFNVLVAKHAKVVATMASTPYYHWFATPGSGSTTFRRSRDEWWHWLEAVVEAIDQDLAGDELAVQRTLLRRHQYRSRLMDAFNNLYERRPAQERANIFAHARRIQEKYFTPDDDEYLARNLKMRAQLLRAGDQHTLLQLTIDDPNIPAAPRVTGARWNGPLLEVEVEASWVDSAGRRFRWTERDGRIVKDLPPRYDGLFASELLDVTDDIEAATIEVGVRSQTSRVTWMAPSRSDAWWNATGGTVDFGVRGVGTIDPDTLVFGKPLERGEWELNARAELGGVVQHRMLPGRIRPAVRVDERGSAAVYTRRDGKVVLDFDQARTALSALVVPTGRAVRAGSAIRIPVTGVVSECDWSGATTLEVNTDPVLHRAARVPVRAVRRLLRRPARTRGWRSVAAVLEVVDGSAHLVVPLPPRRAAAVRIGGRVPDTPTTFLLDKAHTTLTPVTGRWARMLT